MRAKKGARMAVNVEEALARIYALQLRRRTEIVPIETAVGRILAETVTATHNLPPFDNSAMDGYAVLCSDAAKAVECEHTIFAGDKEQMRIAAGQAARIMTGARLPEGAECIVPIEEAETRDGMILLPDGLKAGRHIRLCGEDIECGDELLKTGTDLHAHHITLLASQGISHITVFQKPRVALFASGSELKMHFEPVAAHQLYNTNTPTFAARAQELGCEVQFLGTAADTLEDLHRHIESALGSDLIITSGGVSVGDADYTKEAFAHFGFTPVFEKVNIKPGKPTTLGRIRETLVLNLPGNPLAAALNFELFGRALIHHLSGTATRYHSCIRAELKADFSVRPGRRTLVPGFFDGTTFEVCPKYAPGMISPLAGSNGFLMLDEACDSLKSGHFVNVIPTRFGFNTDIAVSLITR